MFVYLAFVFETAAVGEGKDSDWTVGWKENGFQLLLSAMVPFLISPKFVPKSGLSERQFVLSQSHLQT